MPTVVALAHIQSKEEVSVIRRITDWQRKKDITAFLRDEHYLVSRITCKVSG